MWLSEASEGYLLLHLLGVPVSFPEAFAMEAVIGGGALAGLLVPAGLGVQDASYVAFLRAGGTGVSLELAAAFALLEADAGAALDDIGVCAAVVRPGAGAGGLTALR